MSPYSPNDSIVTYEDAETWATELLGAPPKILEAHLMELEPAVLAMALKAADRVMTLLMRNNVPGPLAQRVADDVIRSGAICCEMTRRGYRKFLSDDPEAPEQDGR